MNIFSIFQNIVSNFIIISGLFDKCPGMPLGKALNRTPSLLRRALQAGVSNPLRCFPPRFSDFLMHLFVTLFILSFLSQLLSV